MRSFVPVVRFVLFLGVVPVVGNAAARLPDLKSARWVWASKRAARDGTFGCYFRRSFSLPERPKSALVLITADNGYNLFVNGSLVGSDSGFDAAYWRSVERYEVTDLLVEGKNVLGVKGENLGGPAGLLVAARFELPNGQVVAFHSDGSWLARTLPETGWARPDHDDAHWRPAAVLGQNGAAPWGPVVFPGPRSPGPGVSRARGVLREAGPDYRWPEGVVFLRGRVPPNTTRAKQSLWPIRGSRAYLEHDAPAPAVLGRQLWALVPAMPDAEPKLLVDARAGVIGSPSVSYDGRTIYFAMAPGGEKFIHIYRVNADGSGLRQLTKGPFHDYDPCELPDGRVVFSSTRIGSREEYHGNLASSLFVMNPDGGDIRPLTYHIVADREPEVTAAGTIVFVRSDNFLERAKVETRLHCIRPDGTGGVVLLGGDRGEIGYDPHLAAEDNSAWLRHYGFGSPAPLPDGRVAALSTFGLVVSGAVGSGQVAVEQVPTAVPLFDISPLPDGRLLCTAHGGSTLGVLHLDTGDVVPFRVSPSRDLHSVVYLGPRPVPPILSRTVRPEDEARGEKSGVLVCQNVFYTRQTAADMTRVKAIRVYEGRALAVRSARHQYDHIGVETVELGTVPIAPDGSFTARVPADRPLALQAIDGEGRAVLNELTWIYVRPGERRTCVGCHSRRASAPSLRQPLAAGFEPPNLLGQGQPHRYRGNNAANGGVLNLQLDRFREAAAINLYSQGPLERRQVSLPLPPGRKLELERLLGQLASGDSGLRVSAARRLGVLRLAEASPALAKALGDPVAEVRLAAAMSLSACGGRDSVPALVKALGDPNPFVAQAANAALEHLTAHSVGFNAFVPDEKAAGRAAWAEWLANNPWDRVEARLVEALAKAPAGRRQALIEALAHVGGEKAGAALRQLLAKVEDLPLREAMAAMRALGRLRDQEAVPVLKGILAANARKNPGRARKLHELGWTQRPVYLAATAAEALGRIATPEAEAVLLEWFPKLLNFWNYSFWTGDHSWLMGCHSSTVHFRLLEALDGIGSKRTAGVVPVALRSVPIDTDRGLLLTEDSYEALVSRVVQRSGLMGPVVETALGVLGDTGAKADARLKPHVVASPPASSCGPLSPESRAAQMLSVVCLDPAYVPRIVAAFERYRQMAASRKRQWVCFFLARALGRLGDRRAVPSLLSALRDEPPEAKFGLEDPPNVFVYKGMTPFYRAAAAFALGRIGDERAVEALEAVVEDFDNALDVRHAAAQALAALSRRRDAARLERLAKGYPEVAIRRILLSAVGRR